MVWGAQTLRRALQSVCLDPILMSAKQSLAGGGSLPPAGSGHMLTDGRIELGRKAVRQRMPMWRRSAIAAEGTEACRGRPPITEH